MFVFGDSLVDNGNNNKLFSIAKANYFPYGIDFYQGPSGRFSNGKTAVDMWGEMLGLPYLPTFVQSESNVSTVLRGVNYASAAGGVLDETGLLVGGRFSLSQQVMNFKSNMNDLRNEMGPNNLTQYLAKSIALIVLGSNDYLNNYLQPKYYNSSHNYTPQDYADHLLNHYSRQILALHSVGLRKFFLAGLGPLGCAPYYLAQNRTPPGQCVSSVNEIVGLFNVGLKSLVDQLNGNHTGAIFLYGNAYGAIGDMINNPSTYGFQVTNEGCCGIGRNKGKGICFPFSRPCANRDQYIFWDAFHPTQAVNAIFAQRTFSGPTSYCYPINIQQMALK
ncbi:GDSL esterase/lipase [Cinnamomum micranthum f. kanehirae]|uniref:GDSL esterase/lipase n=1 Tax=Cinnamomum micranthum f. kanehirae TaxID=337451 RepID=A0A3S3NA63_9MAGN|nr:GDSL esterase/lipase [Cinnamomum micranthum f. kanehirae]